MFQEELGGPAIDFSLFFPIRTWLFDIETIVFQEDSHKFCVQLPKNAFLSAHNLLVLDPCLGICICVLTFCSGTFFASSSSWGFPWPQFPSRV